MYSIGKVAKITNLTVRTLRYYDEIGLLKPATVSEGGHRFYDNAAISKLHNIILLKEFGFELETIHEIVSNQVKSTKDLLQMRLEIIKLEEKQLKNTKEKIQTSIQMMELDGIDNWEAIFNTVTYPESKKQEIKSNLNKFFTENERETLKALPKVGQDIEEVDKWVELVNDIRLNLHKEPFSEDAQDLAARWMHLAYDIFKGDKQLAQKVWQVNWEKNEDIGGYPFDPEIIEFIRKAQEHYLHQRVGGRQ